MAVIVNCGHMTFNTTEGTPAKRPQVPGPTVAESVRAKLAYGFPSSPIIGDPVLLYGTENTPAAYNAPHVASMRTKMMENSVTPPPASEGADAESPDRGDAEGYWGFSTTKTSRTDPSGVDLMYGGAPNIGEMITRSTWDGTSIPEPIIASPYMPNLAVPAHGNGSANFSPTIDNPNPVVIGPSPPGRQAYTDNAYPLAATVVSLPPFEGAGHASNPSSTSELSKQIIPKVIFDNTVSDAEPFSPPVTAPSVISP